MKKLIYITFTLLALTSCLKKDDAPDEATLQEVFFAGITLQAGGEKSTTIDCDNPGASYARVKIDNEDNIFLPAVFYLDDILYTQSIKMNPGTHTVLEFILFNDNNTPGNTADDFIVSATPMAGASYAQYVNNAVPFTFEVSAFAKTEVDIEVLCFEASEYLSFGFTWFSVTEIKVREQFFFGDICVLNPNDYVGSLYEHQLNGVQVDMPAIFRIDVFKNGDYVASFDNSLWYGEGKLLEVNYPDTENATDVFSFDLYILVKEGTEFIYKYYHTWTFNDAQTIPAGADGVVDFVLGDCVADYDLKLNWPDAPEVNCETAYAKSTDDEMATCFIDIQGLETDKWGWSNGAITSGSYEFELWAGAGQCDTENGRYVGTLTVVYEGSDADITYQMLPGYTMNEIHLFAGSEILPRKNNGEFTVVPGQFPIVDEGLGGVTTAAYTVSNLSGSIYVVAHAVVCGPGL